MLVIDKRPHIGGNAYDHKDAAGVLMHKYGPHIFHTNSQEIVSYLSRFTRWRPYEHRVLADLQGVHVPMPINRTTVNTLYGLNLQTEEEVEAFFASRAEARAQHQDLRGRGGVQGRPRTLRALLPGATPGSSGAWTRRSSTSR
ncbi:MAG: NAD(P)-binding protein [Caulobacteraceae bacterium]